MSAGYEGLLPNTFPTSTPVGNADAIRFTKMVNAVALYYDKGIQEQIREIADDLKEELEQTAPYDTQEIDDYHMTEHMKDSPYVDGARKGREVESEAAYSGHLEYGTAYHGVQHIFFRPATEKAWIRHKKECIKAMTEILSK